MEEKYETKLKLRTPHESLGWLGDGPGGLIIISECRNPNCGCHEAVRDCKEKNIHFMHMKSSAD